MLHPDDLPRFGALGVVASMQPGHAPFGGIFPAGGMSDLLRDDQIPLTFAWRDLRRHAPWLCFSTDWPVIGVEVMPSVKAAVAPVDLGPPWRDQGQGLIETLQSYTADNAWLEFSEHCKGVLKPGMLADIAVMSHDLEGMDPAAFDEARAALTLCGGRVTWEA